MIARQTPKKLLAAAGYVSPGSEPNPELVEETTRLMGLSSHSDDLIIEVLKARRRDEASKRRCAVAAEAASNLEQMFRDLLTGHATLWRLVSVQEQLEGTRAICSSKGQIQEFSVHPEVDLNSLKQLEPWHYVRVHENVVIGTCSDDALLYKGVKGELVEFKEYVDRERNEVRVTRHGQGEELVMLARSLQSQELAPGTKLVLQRDEPQWAIDALPGQTARSRFEIPIETITTRLEDLAGMERLTERLVLDVMKRIIHPDIREKYDLDPMKGMLLFSRKPGMGKTSFMRGFAAWLHQLGQQRGFDVVLYHVKPNETKSKWWGEDSRIMREDLFGAMHARRECQTDRPIFQLLILDEIDSLGRRSGADTRVSAAQSDALESFLVEMDGFVQGGQNTSAQSHLLVVGMSNRPDRIDDAVKRPGRLGDLVLDMDDMTQQAAEDICGIYGRNPSILWQLNGQAKQGASREALQKKILRPALAAVFPLVVLHYFSDTQKKYDVTAGEILAGAHYRDAMNAAKNRASTRMLFETGNPAVTYEDVMESLLDSAISVAQQMAADPQMLIGQLNLKIPVARAESVPRSELETHRFLRSAIH